MKSHRILGALVAAVSVLLAHTASAQKDSGLREGDIVFTGSAAGQGEAIIAATGSVYTHCGIVFIKDGMPMVLEAVQPVGVTTLEKFKARSPSGVFMVRRLKAPLPSADYNTARAWGEAQVGKNYDHKFQWSDDSLYCSELVWKIYRHAGVELCPVRHFRDYRLDDPKVRRIIDERYGGVDKLPMNEMVVAPSDIAASPLLEDVAKP